MNLDLDEETLATTSLPDTTEAAAYIPTLTILCHPDPDRIGERLLLRALSIGQEALVSRIEPVFSIPDDEADPEVPKGSPLGGRFLSRQPIRLRPTADPGGIVIDLSTTSTRVEADGAAIDGEQVFSPQQIAGGVVLKLARKIVLMLHLCPLPASREDRPPSLGMVGASSAMERLRQEVLNLAPLDVPVLLRGETGTGKELVARALHDESSRQAGPFVAVNMAVLGPSLAAAALFGAERGAYTGADRNRQGHFLAARGGTLFLDEIGEAPPTVQTMLLRTLETREIQPVGSTASLPTDVRIVAATDARLEEDMADGRFKSSLYHRLAGYRIYLPALRDRREDVGRLLYFFLRDELANLGQLPLGAGEPNRPWPSADLVARLARYPWPGNVRELQNVARRLAIAGPDEPIPDLDVLLPPLPSAGSPAASAMVAKRRALRRLEEVTEAELLETLRENRWHVRATAEALEISRTNLYRLMKASPSVRAANQLGLEEIEDAVAAADGDLEDVAYQLKVSTLGLKRRMKALGLDLD